MRKKFKAVMVSLGGTGDDCGDIRCGDCPLSTVGCSRGNVSLENVQIIMDYEIPVDWNEVQKRADNGEDVRILICDDGADWKRRYFAKYEDNKVYAYADGKTKWSDDGVNKFMPWEYAKLAVEE